MQNVKNKKILVVGPSWLGDMIMSQALFKILKSKFNCTIDIIAPEWSRPIVDRMPEIANSISLPIQHGELALLLRYQLGRKLRQEHYDQAIILTNSWKSALIPFVANIPQRTGWLGEMRWGLLNDVRYLNKQKLPLMMQRYIALGYAKEEEIPQQYPYPKLIANVAAGQELLTKFKVINQGKKILALCPGAAFGSAKRWPVNYFAEVAKMQINAGWDIWFFGSKQDKPVVDNILQQVPMPCVNFAGQLQLAETVDLMALVQVVISNDSGLMHMASGLGKYIVGIYGSTSPEFTPPFGPAAKIVTKNLSCSPCFKPECPLGHHQCMTTITPQHIVELLNKDGW